MGNISFSIAFAAGLLSFVSPCVLPLAPVYVGSVCGAGIFEPKANRRHFSIFFHSLSFVVGFSVIFTALGAIAGLTTFAINLSQVMLNRISGSVMIACGLFMLAAQKVSWLNYEKRLTPSLGNTISYLRSFLIGAFFSLAWTACVGPVVGGIMALALNSATAWQGAYLLATYSLGLGFPFLIMGAAFDFIFPLLKRIQRHANLIQIISGLLLIAVGTLILTNKLVWFAQFAG